MRNGSSHATVESGVWHFSHDYRLVTVEFVDRSGKWGSIAGIFFGASSLFVEFSFDFVELLKNSNKILHHSLETKL